jgi:circadian clock protein KaiC
MEPCSTGVEGLNEILLGGFPPRCVHLVRGDPGSGENHPRLSEIRARVEGGAKVTCADLAQCCGWDAAGVDVILLTEEALRADPMCRGRLPFSGEKFPSVKRSGG